MNNRTFKISTTLALIPITFMCSSCSNKNEWDFTTQEIISLITKNNEPIEFKAKQTVTEADSHEFNSEVLNVFEQNHELIKNEIIFDSFHFINEMNFTVGPHKFTDDNKTFIDLYNEKIVNFSFSFSPSNFITIYNPSKDEKAVKIVFSSIFNIVFIKDYKTDILNISAGNDIKFIFQFQENYFLNINNADPSKEKFPPGNSYFSKDEENNCWNWKQCYPTFFSNNSLNIDAPIYGIIQSTLFDQSNYPISNEYMTQKSWNKFIYKNI